MQLINEMKEDFYEFLENHWWARVIVGIIFFGIILLMGAEKATP